MKRVESFIPILLIVLFLFSILPIPSQAAPGLILGYGFDEGAGATATDESGNGSMATLVGGTTWTSQGKYGSAVSLDGLDDELNAGSAAVIDNLSPMTVSVWVNPSSMGEYGRGMIASKLGSPNNGWKLHFAPNTNRALLFEIKHTTTGAPSSPWTGIYRTTVDDILPLNQWSYVTATWDGTNNISGVRIYVNGQEVSYNIGFGSSGIKVSEATYNLTIGGGTAWHGLIDEFRLYNRVLSLSEIADDMNTPVSAPDTTSPTVAITSPLNGATVSGNVTINASASDNRGVAGVQFFVDSIALGLEDISAPFSTLWSTVGLPDDANYTLAATARDAAGNLGTSNPIVVLVDNLPPPDTTAPLLSNPLPSGTLPSGTTDTDISIVSNENAVCRYNTVAGTDYTAMPNTFGITGGTLHSSPVSSLTDGNSYSFYVRCQDSSSNANTADTLINFDIALPPPPDTTAPVISNISVSSVTANSAVISWTTDEPADSLVEFGYDIGYGSLSAHDLIYVTNHSMWLTGLNLGTTYHYRVHSIDPSGNATVSSDSTFTTLSTPPITPDLVLGYGLEEGTGTTAADESGNGNTATLVNGPVWTTQGKYGGALSFDGVDDILNAGSATVLDDIPAFTASAWVNPDSMGSSGRGIIAGKYSGTNGWKFQFAPGTTNALLLEIKHTTTGTPSGSWAGIYRTTVNNVVPFNQWSYVTVTWDGTNNFSGIRFYVNGQEVSYNTGGGSSGIKVSDTTYNQYVGGGWDGLIDEFRLYNRVLSLSEITSDMNTPLGTPLSADVTPPTVSIASPVNGSTATGTIAVQISSSDDVGIQYVELYRDGILVGKDAVAPYQLMWSTTLVPNGTYNLAARAVDTSNNSATSSTISVTVDNAVAPRFNIVFVITDDQRWDTMQYMPLTTTLIGDAGVTFTNSFVGTPLCCPNRATFLTGQYSHNTGVLDNIINTGIRALDDTSTIATWLEQAGYRTSLIGKYFNRYGSIDLGPPYIPPGWSDWHSHSELGSSGLYYNYNLFENGTTVSYGSQPQDYSTDVLAAKAVQFIESTSQNQPLLLYFTPHAPHSSGGPPIPAPADIGSFSSLPPLRPVSYNEADVSDKPLWIRQLPLLTPTDDSAGDTFRIKQVESLQSVDRAVESIVDALQRTGRLDNTVIIFTSDNGMTWGEHRWLDDKWCLYEECIRAPLMIRVPGVAPRVEDNLVSSVDLAPSIAEWAGALPTNSVDGLSLNTLLNDPTSAWRDELFVEYIGPTYPFGASSRFRAVRTTDSIYGEYDNGDREFYDLMLDSYQLNNAVNNPSYSGEISNLDKTLEILKTQ